MAVEFPLRPLGASLLHESFRERLGAGGEEEEEEGGEEERARKRGRRFISQVQPES